MRRERRAIGAFVAAATLAGLAVVLSGVVPLTASSGHWPITAWFLHFILRRSVATHTIGVPVPSLDEPWLARKGAVHYEMNCRGCHGSPEQPHPAIGRHMTPRPPNLTETVTEWEPAELFYIVKHGVKFTGMPAWPSQQRDDEVWAMVAFLRRLPDLDVAAYREVVDGEAPSGTVAPLDRPSPAAPETAAKLAAEVCGRCHGGGGRGAPAFPRLAGQRSAYLLAALRAFARGERHSGIMGPVAANLRSEQMRELALHYGSLDARSGGTAPAVAGPAVERGRTIAEKGIPSQRVPSCTDCHGPGPFERNPAYPQLAGQHAEYLALQLELFREDRRGGSAYARLMRPVAGRLTSEQMRDVALYYQSLGR